jgi:hypothetical protein
MAMDGGLHISQAVVNAIGNFDVHAFRTAVVQWLVDNNHPLRELETTAFRTMIEHANPEAERALWKNHESVRSFVMKLYDFIKPRVIQLLAGAISMIHISFNGWTTKGGKRGFLGVVAHFADAYGKLRDPPIALPQLTGAHTGENIAEVIASILRAFDIPASKVGYFVIDNATNNDSAVAALARKYGFIAGERRLRCGPHTLNLAGQKVLWGSDGDSYNNTEDNAAVS